MKRISVLTMLLCLLPLVLSSAAACPFCLSPMQTWSEMVMEADALVLAKIVTVFEGTEQKAPFAVVEVTTIHKGRSVLPKSRTFRVDEYIFGKPGDLVLLKGNLQNVAKDRIVETFATDENSVPVTVAKPKSDIQKVSATAGAASRTLTWDFAESVSQAAFDYVANLPSADSSPTERLTYCLPFLEHSDKLISADAWGEFAKSSYADIVAVQELLPREKLRKWISMRDTTAERLGLYGMMLGLCGTDADATFLKQQIGQPINGRQRYGVEGLMGGLLMLTGENGLQFLEESRLKNPNADGLECLATVQALEFIWEHESALIDRNRLRASLHPMLNRMEMREIAIRDLSRWKDWSIIPRLSQLYDECHEDDFGSAAAIVGYVITCNKSDSASADQKQSAEKLLARIKQNDPHLVRRTERMLR